MTFRPRRLSDDPRRCRDVSDAAPPLVPVTRAACILHAPPVAAPSGSTRMLRERSSRCGAGGTGYSRYRRILAGNDALCVATRAANSCSARRRRHRADDDAGIFCGAESCIDRRWRWCELAQLDSSPRQLSANSGRRADKQLPAAARLTERAGQLSDHHSFSMLKF